MSHLYSDNERSTSRYSERLSQRARANKNWRRISSAAVISSSRRFSAPAGSMERPRSYVLGERYLGDRKGKQKPEHEPARGNARGAVPKAQPNAARKTQRIPASHAKKRRRSSRHGRITLAAALVIIALLGGVMYGMGRYSLTQNGAYDFVDQYGDAFLTYYPGGSVVERTLLDLSDSDVYSTVSCSDGRDVRIAEYCYSREPQPFWRDLLSRSTVSLKAAYDQIYGSWYGINLYATVEAGTESIEPSLFSSSELSSDIEFTTPPTRSQLDNAGCYTLSVSTGGCECSVLLFVTDTTVPTAEIRKLDAWLDDDIQPCDLIVSLSDASPVVLTYSGKSPDTSVVGEQPVGVNVTDCFGNSLGTLRTMLNVRKDEQPPVIEGAVDRTIQLGDAVLYKAGISVSDDRDTPEQIELSVDSSAVDTGKTGIYPVVYTATDRCGNTSSVTVNFRFASAEEIDIDRQLDEYVNAVAAEIFKDDMTTGQKIFAIYSWCRGHIYYTGHSEKDDWHKAAVIGYKTHCGDCYTYFACAKSLFEYCGIPNIDVEKLRTAPTQARHYWSLVDGGTGYYHVDCTPRDTFFNGCMRTDEQLKRFSDTHRECHRMEAGKYPATPTEPYSFD